MNPLEARNGCKAEQCRWHTRRCYLAEAADKTRLAPPPRRILWLQKLYPFFFFNFFNINMKLSLTAAAIFVSLAVADGIVCPGGFQPGDRWCQTAGAASDILYCNNKHVGEAISHCPGRCINRASDRRAYCEYSGWDDPCEKNPSYNVWCDKDGGPSGIRVCTNGRFPITSFCDGICESNGGHALCLPEGFNDKCPGNTQEGRSYCDVEAGPGKIRKCENGRFVVQETCADICDPNYGYANCLTRIH
ncbi:hypothetical protein LMH87_002941 [Akanthomyces muscarius]|uniref:Uncharacterized protein n=1 Tax=Akanthomyces muscarius TaxID=2231603 RepID=A0A9W8Q9D3_AKAMU|nr:hypothetical protein LMH87_002941 [Akanthomyces muscarius]KAJ4148475.1 hypothetical protein LMH87_002941 [Akanthomyces muscarius]